MPPPTRPTPRTSRTDAVAVAAAVKAKDAAVKAKDAAVDLANEVAGDLVQGIKKSNRYAKLKAAVVGAWLALTVITLWVASSPSGPSNSLGAQARLQTTSVGLVVSIRNDSEDAIWTEVRLVLDDDWAFEGHRVFRPGEGTTVRLEDFRHEGMPPPAELRPRKLTIQTEQGRVSLPLVEARN
jgi:hypothetical protein